MPVGSDLLLILIVILIIVVIWRGPKTLPGLGTALGQAVKGARDAARDLTEGHEEEAGAGAVLPTAPAAPPAAPPPGPEQPGQPGPNPPA